MKGLPLSRFYSFDEIGDVFRGSQLSFDSHGRLAIVQDGVYRVLNDEAWINLSGGAPGGIKLQRVARDLDGTSYYGALGSWGVLSTNEDGLLRPLSLVPEAPPRWVMLTYFNEICTARDAIYFAGRNGVVRLDRDTRRTSFIELPGLVRLFTMGSTVCASTFERGIFRFDSEPGAAEPASESPLAGLVVDHVASLPNGRAMISTFARQLFAWDGAQLIPCKGALGGRLEGRASAIQALPENLFAIAIAGMGLYIINQEGEIITSLTHAEYRLVSSLANNEPGVLWAATETGVAKILYGTPVTSFGHALGLPIGWPQFVTWDDRTITASNGRVYESMPPVASGEPAQFRLMDPQPGAGAWGIASHGGWLLLGNSDGVFARQPGQPFQTVLGNIAVARLHILESGECLVIGEKQITALRLESQGWQECAARVPGAGYPSVVRASKQAAWIEIGANHVARIGLREGKITTRLFDSYPWKDPRWISVSVLGNLVILSGPEAGRIYFDENTQELVEAPALEPVLQRMPYWPARIQPDETGLWWVSHPHGIFTFDPAADPPAADTASYRAIHEHAPLVQILPGRQVWASNGRTLFRLEPAPPALPVQPFRPRVVSISDLRSNRELILGADPTRPALLRLRYSENSLSLRFFAGTYALRPTPEYEYRLNRAAWRSLGATPLLRLSDLREGEYHLDVRLVDTRGPLGEQTSVAFVIAPPWFRTTYAYVGATLSAAAIVFGLVHFSLRRAEARNAALENLVAKRTGELKATMTKLEKEVQTTATLAERNRLAGEIHDGVEQGFAGLAMHLEAMGQFASCPPELRRELAVAVNMLTFSRNEMRHVVQNLHSPVLASVDLETALRQVIARIAPAPGYASVVRHGTAVPLGSTIEHHLLRIAQEAVANAVKHASAQHLEVILTYSAREVQLVIRDDGRGFDPAVVLSGDFGHFGLASFKGRAEKVGGTVMISSRPGKGTNITVRLPLPSSNVI